MLIRFAAEKMMEDFYTGSQDQESEIIDKETIYIHMYVNSRTLSIMNEYFSN